MKIILKYLYQKVYFCWQKIVLFCSNFFVGGKNFLKQNKVFLIKIFIPLLIIVFGYCSCIYSQHVITKNVRAIFSISEAIRQHFADKPSYWGLDTEYVIKQNIVSPDIIKNNQLRLNGGITILVGSGIDASTVMPMTQNFDIILPHLNKAQCMSYAEANLLDEEYLALISLNIINSSGTHTFEWGGENSLPIKKYATKQLCQDKENTLIWSLK
jgi:hypothetical protein